MKRADVLSPLKEEELNHDEGSLALGLEEEGRGDVAEAGAVEPVRTFRIRPRRTRRRLSESSFVIVIRNIVICGSSFRFRLYYETSCNTRV